MGSGTSGPGHSGTFPAFQPLPRAFPGTTFWLTLLTHTLLCLSLRLLSHSESDLQHYYYPKVLWVAPPLPSIPSASPPLRGSAWPAPDSAWNCSFRAHGLSPDSSFLFLSSFFYLSSLLSTRPVIVILSRLASCTAKPVPSRVAVDTCTSSHPHLMEGQKGSRSWADGAMHQLPLVTGDKVWCELWRSEHVTHCHSPPGRVLRSLF